MAKSSKTTATSLSQADTDLRAYVDRLRQLASNTESIYLSPHLENLAGYLERGLELFVSRDTPLTTSRSLPSDPYFMSLCDLRKPSNERVQKFNSPWDFWEATNGWQHQHLQSLVVFLRGYPSPEWLVAVGTRYDLDYSFLSNHLHFRATVGKPNYFGVPMLPSSECLPQLRMTTIGGLVRESSHPATQDFVDALRSRNSKSMEEYLADLRADRNTAVGDSIIREFSTHDGSHFSLEQDISISVKDSASGWAAVVWMDHGRDLAYASKTSWLSRPLSTEKWKVSYFPTIYYGKTNAVTPTALEYGGSAPKNRQQLHYQSASLFPEYYCSTINAELAAEDSFYAVSEILTFSAVSESQALNLMESKIAKETDSSVLPARTDLSLTNLLYHKQILERHILRIDENVRMIKARSDQDWPRSNQAVKIPDMMLQTDEQAMKILKDFQYLLSRAQDLSRRCETGMQIVMQNLQVRESKEQIKEAKSVTNLTRLAFVFIPLSFTASVFGVNVKQLGQGDVSIWVFFVTSLPVFAISVMLLFFHPRLLRLFHNLTEKGWLVQRLLNN